MCFITNTATTTVPLLRVTLTLTTETWAASAIIIYVGGGWISLPIENKYVIQERQTSGG